MARAPPEGRAGQRKIVVPGRRDMLPFERPSASGKGDPDTRLKLAQPLGYRQRGKEVAASATTGEKDVLGTCGFGHVRTFFSAG